MSQPFLSASTILDAVDLKFQDVDVPEWGGTIRLQQLNAEESSTLADAMATVTGEKGGMYLMIIRCARGADGQRIFTDDDLPRLKQKNMNVLMRLQRIALELNQMDATGKAALKKDLSEAVIAASPIV